MTKQELQDTARRIATGNFLTEQFTEAEYQVMTNDDIDKVTALVYCNYDTDDIRSWINGLCYTIKLEFEECTQDKEEWKCLGEGVSL